LVRRRLTKTVALAIFFGCMVTSAQARDVSTVATTSHPLETGVMPLDLGASEIAKTLARTRSAGATFVRLILWWSAVAPSGTDRPADFDARNHRDPRYQWGDFDRIVGAAVAAGVQPVVSILDAPDWADTGACPGAGTGPCRPNPSALADLATAAATRYSGRAGFPRVRYWQAWNEPNLDSYLKPQTAAGTLVAPELYRAMVNAMAGAVHAVHRDNMVIAGGLAPFGGNSNDPSAGTHDQERIRPLEFMRSLLCMSKGPRPTATCNETIALDVWSHHPYTYGGPTHSAFHPDDVSIGDLDEMRVLLDAAKRAGRIRSPATVQFWVTEFSYDSRPGDPKGLPPALHARWVSEALYRMWSDGVSLVTWFLIRDQPFPQEFFQSGLYTSNGKPKPALRAFRFPFVAFWRPNASISFWGRTPGGVKAAVVVEQRSRGRWRRVTVPTVNRHGIFMGVVKAPRGSGLLRARLANGKDVSQPFSLKQVKDFRFCPWGSFC
jgi:hypothetical protein